MNSADPNDKSLGELIADANDRPLLDDPLLTRLAHIIGRQQTEIEQLREVLIQAGIEVSLTERGAMTWRRVS